MIIDERHSAAFLTCTADVNLAAGPHAIRVEYYEGTGDAHIVFSFQPLP